MTQPKYNGTTYAQADAYLGRKTSRPVANNTRLERRADGTIAVRLHRTDVVTYYADGFIQLDSGGWHTMTTFERINRFAPVYVYRHKWLWHIVPTWTARSNDAPYFEDGMTVLEG